MKEEFRRALWPNGPRQDVWAVVDAAQDQKVYWSLTNSFLRHSCLFAGRLPEALEMAAPYIVQLDPEDKFTEYLADNMGRSLGIFLRCDLSLEDVRHHLRTFLTVKDMSGRKMLFRYYDPRVLRVYLPTCTNSELQTVFGPIKSYWAEADQPGTLTQFEVVKGKGLVAIPQVVIGATEVAGDELAPEVVPAQKVLVLQRGVRNRVPILLQGAGGGARLRRSSGAIRIYRTPTITDELPQPDGAYAIPPSNLDPDVTVYAEATAPGEVTLTLEPSRGGKAQATITAVEVEMETGGAVCTGVHSGRRRIDILSPSPRSFQGRLTLRTAGAGPSLNLFTTATSITGFPLADGFSFDVPRDKVSFWIEGETASAAVGDVALQLFIEGGSVPGFTCPVTVAEIGATRARVPATPSRAARLPVAESEAQLLTRRLVMLTGAGASQMEAESKPTGLPVKWTIERASDDGEASVAASAQSVPDLVNTPSGATVTANAVGSFRLTATVGGDGDWGGPTAEMELHLVQAKLIENLSTVNGRLCAAARVPGTDLFRIHSGKEPAVRLEATVQLTGGGPDGRRGTESIRGGWIGNIVSDNAGARYKGGTTATRTYTYTVDNETRTVDFESGPILDAPAGERLLPTNEIALEQPLRFTAEMAPATEWRVTDGAAIDKTIEQIWRYLDCQVYLTLWSIDAPGQLGVLLQSGWSFTGDYTCNTTKTIRTVVPARLAATRAVVFPSLVPAAQTELEAHPPASGRSSLEES